MVDPISYIALLLGLDPAQTIASLTLTMLVCNWLARLIPDDSTGILWFLNRAFSIIGLYASNRIGNGVTVNEVAKAMLPPPDEIKASKGLFNNTNGSISLQVAFSMAILGIAFLLAGCATTQNATGYICKNQAAIRAAAQATIDAVNLCPIE